MSSLVAQARRLVLGRRRGGPEEVGHPTVQRFGQADAHLGPERRRQVLCEHGPERAAVRPPDQLADQEAEGVGVVSVGRARRPPGLLCRERGRHELVVEHAPGGSRRRTAGSPAGGRAARRPSRRPSPPPRTPASGGSPGPRRQAAGSTRRATHSDARALPTEKKLTSASRRHGTVRASSDQPPPRSTTTSPRTATQTDAPSSPWRTKLSTNRGRTGSNPAAHEPSTGTGRPSGPAPRGRRQFPERWSMAPKTRRNRSASWAGSGGPLIEATFSSRWAGFPVPERITWHPGSWRTKR